MADVSDLRRSSVEGGLIGDEYSSKELSVQCRESKSIISLELGSGGEQSWEESEDGPGSRCLLGI